MGRILNFFFLEILEKMENFMKNVGKNGFWKKIEKNGRFENCGSINFDLYKIFFIWKLSNI